MPTFEYPNETALLAADVVSLEQQLLDLQRDLRTMRDMLSIALEMCVELAREAAIREARW